MQATRWKDIAELVGIAAIVGSLIFVGLQMRQAQEIAIAEGYSEIDAAVYSRSELISSHASLIAKANRGENLDDAERLALYEFVYTMWASHFFAERRWEHLERVTGGSSAYFAGFLCRNPGLVQMWIDQTAWARTTSGSDGDMGRFILRVESSMQDSPFCD